MGYELKPSDVYDLARVLDADVHEKGGELFFTYCPYCRGGESRDKNTFSVNLTSGAFKCFRSGCGKAGHFVELARDFHYQLDFDNTTRRRCTGSCPSARSRPGRRGCISSVRGIGRAIVERYRITTRRPAGHPGLPVLRRAQRSGLCQIPQHEIQRQRQQGVV